MHILIAPDSFKESLSAPQVAQALQTGFSQALLDASFDLLPVGDGGEGTMAALTAAFRSATECTKSVTSSASARCAARRCAASRVCRSRSSISSRLRGLKTRR